MNTAMRRATAIAIPSVAAGVLILLRAVRPGMGIASIVLAVALFAAGGVNERYRLLWIPFVAIGLFLAALNFTSLNVPSEPTGLLLCVVGISALLLAAGSNWLRSVLKRVRP